MKNGTAAIDTVRPDGLKQDFVTSACPDVFSQEGATQAT